MRTVAIKSSVCSFEFLSRDRRTILKEPYCEHLYIDLQAEAGGTGSTHELPEKGHPEHETLQAQEQHLQLQEQLLQP
jgi:hypothetical protein